MKILHAYDKYLVVPKKFITKKENRECKILKFDNKLLFDVNGYSSLLMSPDFYEKFTNYKYILIAQLDTFIFRDELLGWIDKNYDYVGAPWTFDVRKIKHVKEILPKSYRYRKLFPLLHKNYLVGNGGLSLRKVDKFIKVLKENVEKIDEYQNKNYQFAKKGEETAFNEDKFWSLYVPQIVSDFKIPGFQEALKFAFEVNPRMCLGSINFNYRLAVMLEIRRFRILESDI